MKIENGVASLPPAEAEAFMSYCAAYDYRELWQTLNATFDEGLSDYTQAKGDISDDVEQDFLEEDEILLEFAVTNPAFGWMLRKCQKTYDEECEEAEVTDAYIATVDTTKLLTGTDPIIKKGHLALIVSQ
jgi:hypothetical protein